MRCEVPNSLASAAHFRDKPLRSYGRRQARVLKPNMAHHLENLLPQLRVPFDAYAQKKLEPRILFDADIKDVWLEIGFGAGEHLVTLAARHPDIGMLGCEPFVNGVAKLLSQLSQNKLANIRIHDGDAQDILPWLARASIGKAFLLFPDPWPKTRHLKRRFLNDRTVEILAHVLRDGAEFHFASDSASYCRQAIELFHRHADFEWQAQTACDWRLPWAGWVPTRYEAKALKAGRKCCYLRFLRRPRP